MKVPVQQPMFPQQGFMPMQMPPQQVSTQSQPAQSFQPPINDQMMQQYLNAQKPQQSNNPTSPSLAPKQPTSLPGGKFEEKQPEKAEEFPPSGPPPSFANMPQLMNMRPSFVRTNSQPGGNTGLGNMSQPPNNNSANQSPEKNEEEFEANKGNSSQVENFASNPMLSSNQPKPASMGNPMQPNFMPSNMGQVPQGMQVSMPMNPMMGMEEMMNMAQRGMQQGMTNPGQQGIRVAPQQMTPQQQQQMMEIMQRNGGKMPPMGQFPVRKDSEDKK